MATMNIRPLSEADPLDAVVESFLQRYRRGEHPTVTKYVERYPELAERIRETFPALAMIEELGSVGGQAAATVPIDVSCTTKRLGDYRLLRVVGRGGMGIVYEAVQESLGRLVALKVLPSSLAGRPQYLERFQREARAAARLHHTNIVPVFGVGEENGICYYAMQFIQGQGLEVILEDVKRLRGVRAIQDNNAAAEAIPVDGITRSLLTGQFIHPATTVADAGIPATGTPVPAPSSQSTISGEPEARYFRSIARLGLQAAEGLAHAHSQGVLHRDVKPSNLLLDADGTLWITDFGLAKAEDSGNLTGTGDILGTVRYMAPERFQGKADARCDVYALGVTLYEMLTLRPPFIGRDQAELIGQITDAKPAALHVLAPAIPRDLETIVAKAMARDADQRYATATELADDLRAFLENRPIRARRASAVEQFLRWCHRNPTVAALTTAVALLVVTLGTGTWLTTLLRSDRDQALANQERAEKAERENKIRSHLANATAYRRSGRPGQQVKALEEIRKALDLGPSLELKQQLRNEAIAAIVLPDLQVVQEWEGFPLGTAGLILDPDFERYARGDNTAGKVGIYRVSDNELLCTLEGAGPLSGWKGVEFSPDGRFLHQVCDLQKSSFRYRSRLWKLDGLNPRAIVDDEHGLCAFEPQGGRCALAYPDQTIRLVDLKSGKEIKRISHSLGAYPQLMAWNPRYSLLAVSSRNRCQVFDVDSGAVRADLPETGAIDWHPDGTILAVAAKDLKIYLLDYRTGQLVLPPLELGAAGAICRFNHAGSWLVSNDWSNLTRVWDPHTGRQLLTFQGGHLNQVFSRNDALLGPFGIGKKVQLLRCLPGKGLRTVPAGKTTGPFEGSGRACVDETGRWLAVSARKGTTLIDLAFGSDPVVLPERENYPLRFDSADHSLWTFGDNGLLRWPIRGVGADSDPVRVGPAQLLRPSTGGVCVGASQDGTLVAIPRFGQGASLWHRPTKKTVRLGPQDDVRCCAVSPDGRWVATGSHWLRQGGGAKIWDAVTGKQIVELPVGGLCAVHFSPGAKWLATSSTGYRLWEVDTWREGPSLSGTNYSSYTCAFTVDDKLLALEDEPGMIRIVSPETGWEVVRLTVPAGTRLMPLCFTQDGARLAAVGAETNDLYLFDLRAIREELQAINLDWDAPPLPRAPEDLAKPIQWVVETADFLRWKEADRLTMEAAQFAAEKKYAQALDTLREAIQTDPTHARAHNNLAWALLTGHKELRDAKAALPLARKAVELKPKQFLYYKTLGVALYRTGSFKEAMPILEKSLGMGNGTADALDLFFLAMCHQQLGETAKAKDCYDRATKWVETQHNKLNPTSSAELTEFEAEARGVLSLPEVSPKK
jgi:serine/threonine protein kinase/WD40 repeat protein/Tfp pilus assembly protein PilF